MDYNRLTEIATYLKDMLKDDGYSGKQIVDYLNENFDANLDESDSMKMKRKVRRE